MNKELIRQRIQYLVEHGGLFPKQDEPITKKHMITLLVAFAIIEATLILLLT